MTMELLIALVLIVAISELKEWRFAVRMRKQRDHLTQVQADIAALFDYCRRQGAMTEDDRLVLAGLKIQGLQLADSLAHASEFIRRAETDLATIVNEYKINGIPLGYKRGNQKIEGDFVEGL